MVAQMRGGRSMCSCMACCASNVFRGWQSAGRKHPFFRVLCMREVAVSCARVQSAGRMCSTVLTAASSHARAGALLAASFQPSCIALASALMSTCKRLS